MDKVHFKLLMRLAIYFSSVVGQALTSVDNFAKVR